ncbi:MAG TPA: hypothetical protein DEA08_37780 [Planctomycetes bacterium]|nr:hypothetical protein [Planctomycetota bacterium]
MRPLPGGYERIEHGGARVVLRSDLREALLAAGVSDPAELIARQPASDKAGRAALARVELEGVGPVLVRALTRGGLFGKLVRRLSWDPERAESELSVSATAAQQGANVPTVLAAVTRSVAGGYLHGLVSQELVGARDLVAVLREEQGRARSRALAAAGEAIRLLHEAGVDHVDLNLKNVLIDREGRGVVIDLDRCRIGADPVSEDTRRRNLLRLYRSWVKLSVAEPASVAAWDPLRLARAYARGERERLRALVDAGRAASFWSHRLRWSLFPPRFR